MSYAGIGLPPYGGVCTSKHDAQNTTILCPFQRSSTYMLQRFNYEWAVVQQDLEATVNKYKFKKKVASILIRNFLCYLVGKRNRFAKLTLPVYMTQLGMRCSLVLKIFTVKKLITSCWQHWTLLKYI